MPEKDIPNYIISKNLYGLDIDERAVQLTALNLYIKAKEKIEMYRLINLILFAQIVELNKK